MGSVPWAVNLTHSAPYLAGLLFTQQNHNMSSRYMSRGYGESGSVSRAQSVVADGWSRASSQVPELGSGFSSRASTPVGDCSDRPWSSASTYNYYTSTHGYNTQQQNTAANRDWTADLIPLERAGKMTAPCTVYSDALIKSSRKLRERSLSPTRNHVAIVRPVSQYKENQDYYRGKVKSIYEREPMFAEFVRNLPLTDLHATNSSDLSRLKRKFQYMIEDRWGRKQCNDPSVPHDIAIKTSPWSNYLSRSEPASVLLAEKHRYRGNMPVIMPRITVYHRSTLK